MPAARAAARSSAGVSPTYRASPGGQPASSSAGAKIAGSGLRTPASAEVTTPSSAPPSPQRSSTSGSETSQFDTQTSLQAEPAQLGQRRRRVGKGPEADRGHHRLDRHLLVPAPSRAPRRSGRAARRASPRRAPRGCDPCSSPSRRAPRSPGARPAATPSASARCTQGGSSSTRVPSASNMHGAGAVMRAFSRRNQPERGRREPGWSRLLGESRAVLPAASFWEQPQRPDLGRDHDGGRDRDRVRRRPPGDRQGGARGGQGGRGTAVARRRDPAAARPSPRLRGHPGDRRRPGAEPVHRSSSGSPPGSSPRARSWAWWSASPPARRSPTWSPGS